MELMPGSLTGCEARIVPDDSTALPPSMAIVCREGRAPHGRGAVEQRRSSCRDVRDDQ